LFLLSHRTPPQYASWDVCRRITFRHYVWEYRADFPMGRRGGRAGNHRCQVRRFDDASPCSALRTLPMICDFCGLFSAKLLVKIYERVWANSLKRNVRSVLQARETSTGAFRRHNPPRTPERLLASTWNFSSRRKDLNMTSEESFSLKLAGAISYRQGDRPLLAFTRPSKRQSRRHNFRFSQADRSPRGSGHSISLPREDLCTANAHTRFNTESSHSSATHP